MALKKYMAAIALSLVTLLGTNAYAAITVYDVTSTGKINCSGSPHGLWTNKLKPGGGSCGSYFDYQAGSTLTVDTTAGTAVLQATAINPDGHKAVINFTWTNLTDAAGWAGMVKNGGGGDPSTWLYFGQGTGSVDFFSPSHDKWGMASLMVVPNTALQLGWGANDKTSAFGGSSYSGRGVDGRTNSKWGGHWDFNMDLAARVPEPGTIALLAAGLIGLTLKRRQAGHRI